jgi:radical SAM-linked protein
VYRPVRERNVGDICSFAAELIAATGYDEVSLLSLDSGDYTHINELLASLSAYFNPKNVSLSLPSLRAETVNPSVLNKAAGVRKGGFTIAPEAATQQLRDIINKNITEMEIINAALYAKQTGYNGAKLYFMCGLPYEKDEDILAIADLVKKIESAVKGGRRFDITVSVSNFVPKPFTPFETFGQNPPDELLRKHKLLKDAVKKLKVQAKLKFHDVFTSVIEAAISRGDERWHAVFVAAVKKHFYLEAWGDFFSRERWEELFAETRFNPLELSERAYSDEERLCWDIVDAGVSKVWLQRERNKAAECKTTPDCRKGGCNACGVCDFKSIANVYAFNNSANLPKEELSRVYNKYAVIYRRRGTAALLSALDSSRLFVHLLLTIGVKLKYSEGFNPQPKIVLLAPLPVGVEGEREFAFIECETIAIDSFIERLNQVSIDGLEFLSIETLSTIPRTADFEAVYRFDDASFAFLLEKLENREAEYSKIGKHGEVKTVNLSDYLLSVGVGDVRVNITPQGGFHFPEFFRKSAYPNEVKITRKELILL